MANTYSNEVRVLVVRSPKDGDDLAPYADTLREATDEAERQARKALENAGLSPRVTIAVHITVSREG